MEAIDQKKAILVVSFGTTYTESCEKTIGAIEREIAAVFPEYVVFRAFTSDIIMKILRSRDGVHVDTVTSAMEKIMESGYQDIIIQPTHVMNGLEYEDMLAQIRPFQMQYRKSCKIQVGEPLLTSMEDYHTLVEILKGEIPERKNSKTAIVFMGHGTSHYANSSYAALDYYMKHNGFENGYVGTVEGYPDIQTVQNDLGKSDIEQVVLYPLMIVTGDHAHNDMIGEEEDSWIQILGKEYQVSYVMKGLGEYAGIREMYVKHIQKCISL